MIVPLWSYFGRKFFNDIKNRYIFIIVLLLIVYILFYEILLFLYVMNSILKKKEK